MDKFVAILLMHFDEEQAFWAFVHLMGDIKYLLGDVFIPGFPKLEEDLFIHKKLLKLKLPKLLNHFDKMNQELGLDIPGVFVDGFTRLYAQKWYMLYMVESLPFDITIRCLDVIFLEGSDFLFSVCLGILKLYESSLLKMDVMQVNEFFKRELSYKPIDTYEFMHIISQKFISKKEIEKFRGEFQSLQKK
jgi:hypothetical protein